MRLYWAVSAIFIVIYTGNYQVNGLTCRSGFNTSIYGIPIQFWDESSQCSSASQQSCFVGEMSYETPLLEDNIALTYGSCISSAYETLISCDELYTEGGLNVDRILLMLPDLQGQLNIAIDVFSKQAADEVMEFIKNERGQFDNVKLIQSVFYGLNVTIPENVKPVLEKLDSLLLTAVLNVSQVEKASNQLLLSFKNLSTPDTAASKLMYDLFERNKVPVPDNYKPMIDNLPGFIMQFFKDDQNYQVINSTLYEIIANININNPLSLAYSAPQILKTVVPSTYRLSPVFDSLPPLIDELLKGNYEYVNTWSINLMKEYSRETPGTEALSNSIFELLKRFDIYENITEDMKTLIKYQAGYFYNFFENTDEIEYVLFNMSAAIDVIDPSAKLDSKALLESFGVNLNIPGMDQQFSTIDRMIEVVSAGNWTGLGIYSLQSLKDTSTMTTESLALGNSINDFLIKLNITMEKGVKDMIKYLPGLFISTFPQNFDLINMIYSNISNNLNNFDLATPNYGDIMKSSFSPLLMLNLTSELRALLDQMPSQLNMSDPIGSLESAIELVIPLIPANLNATLPLLIGLPNLMNELIKGNYSYINTWQINIMKSFSVTTKETEKLNRAIIDLSKRFGFEDAITTETTQTIKNQLGMFYTALPESKDEFSTALTVVTAVIETIDNKTLPNITNVISLLPAVRMAPAAKGIVASLEQIIEVTITEDGGKILPFPITENFENFNGSNLDFSIIIESILKQFEDFNITIPNEIQSLIREIPSNINYSDPVGSMQLAINSVSTIIPPEMKSSIVPVLNTLPELLNQLLQNNYEYYYTTWQLELLKAVSRITPSTEQLRSSIFDLLKRYNIFGNLTNDMKTLLTYQPGYLYLYFPENEDVLEYAYGNISIMLNMIDPSGPPDMKDILDLLSKTVNLDVTILDQLIPTLQGFINSAMTGNITNFGFFSIEALKNSSKPTAESTRLSNSIVNLLARLDVTLPEEVKNVIMYFPGMFTASFPDDINTIDAVFANISQGLENSDFTSPPDLDVAIQSTIKQLEMLGVKLPAEVLYLLQEIPSKINFSDPVGSLQASIDLVETIIPTEMNATIPVLNTLPELVNQFMQGNFLYINTWQLELLKTVSRKTSATEQLSAAIFDLTKRFGVYENLTDDMRTAISYLPGYYYLFFLENSQELDAVLRNMSLIINNIDPATAEPDLMSIISGIISPSLIPTEVDQAAQYLEKIIEGIITKQTPFDILVTAGTNLLLNSSAITTESTALSNSIFNFLNKTGITLDSRLNNLIAYFPGLIVTAARDNVTLVNSLYLNISESLDAANITTVDQPISFLARIIYNTLKGYSLIDSFVRSIGEALYIGLNSSEESIEMTNSIIQFFQRMNVTLDDAAKDNLNYFPAMFLTSFADNATFINEIYRSISQNLNVVDTTSADLTMILESTIEQLKMLNTTIPVEIQTLLKNLVSSTNFSDPIGSFQLAMNTLTMYRGIDLSEDSLNMTNSIIHFLESMNVTLDDAVKDALKLIPALFLTSFPEKAALINEIYHNISQNLNTAYTASTDLNMVLESTIEQLEMLNITIPAETQKLLKNLVSNTNLADPIGSLRLAMDTLTMYRGIDVSEDSQNMTNSIIYFLESMNITLDGAVKDALKLIPALFLTSFPEKDALINEIYRNISQNLNTADTTSTDLNMVLESTIEQLEMLNITIPAETQKLLKNLMSNTNLSDPIGSLRFAMNTLTMYRGIDLSEDSLNMTDSILHFLESMNVTLDSAIKDALKLIPAMFLSSFPENAALINEIYRNISQNLNTADTTSPDLNLVLENTIEQLEKMNITIPVEIQTELENLVSNTNLSDPIGSLRLALNSTLLFLPPDARALLPTLQSLPDLLEQLMLGNFEYITTWQLNLLKSYSRITPATQMLSNSVYEMTKRFGVYNDLTPDLRTLIDYQPGYFYMFVPGYEYALNMAYSNLSTIIDSINSTSSLDLTSVLKQAGYNSSVVPVIDSIVLATEELLKAASSGNVSIILQTLLESLKNLSSSTDESLDLSNTILDFIGNVKVSLPLDVLQVINSVPGIFISVFPDQAGMINTVYTSISQGIRDSIMSSNLNIEQIIDDTIKQLNASGLAIPRDLKILLDNLAILFDAVTTNDLRGINNWLVDVMPLLSTPSTNTSIQLAISINNLLSQIEGLETSGLRSAVNYLVTFPYQLMRNKSQTIDITYNSLADVMININLTATVFDPSSLSEMFDQIDASFLPQPLDPLFASIETLIMAALTNNETLFMQWSSDIHTYYCRSNNVTKAFAQQVSNMLLDYGINIPESAQLGLECVPGSLYATLPHQSDMITNIFSQMSLSYTNYTAYIEEQFRLINVTVPLELTALLEKLPEIHTALVQQNMTHVLTLLTDVQKSMVKESELSKLVMTILAKVGVKITDDIKMAIEQVSNSAYNPAWHEVHSTLDTIFSSLNEDITADRDIGVAIQDAFTKANVPMFGRLVPVLDNIQSLIDAIIINNVPGITDAILNMLISYNASFPSEQIQLSIYFYRLQLALMNNMNTLESRLPEEAFVQINNLYQLFLKSANLTEEDLRRTLLQVFPDGRPIIEIFFQLDPKRAFSSISNFAYWIFDPERNATTLASYINSTVHLLLEQTGVSIPVLLRTLVEPKSCFYEVCKTDMCNVRDILQLPDPVTPTTSTVSSTSSGSSSSTSTSLSTTSGGTDSSSSSSTTETPTTPTTSGDVRNSYNFVSSTLIWSSILFSFNWLNI